jgi:heme/copper-type cytochrome/quinol oxidase subunit 2
MKRVPAALLGAAASLVVAAPLPAQTAREVLATKGGWRPSLLNAKRGEATRLVLRTEDGERCFAIDELRIEKRIVPGRATTLEFTPDRTGNFAFYDCLSPEAKKGRLAVTE